MTIVFNLIKLYNVMHNCKLLNFLLLEKKTTTNAKKERKVTEDLNNESLMTPPSSLTEEESLVINRRFILPLIEAKEAAQIYEIHAKNMK